MHRKQLLRIVASPESTCSAGSTLLPVPPRGILPPFLSSAIIMTG